MPVDEPENTGGIFKFQKTLGDILIESGLIVFSILPTAIASLRCARINCR